MSDWKIGLSDEPGKHLLIADFLTARWAWKRLSKPAREAVEAAYPDGAVEGHWRTHASLERHGFVAWDNAAQACTLTEAGKAVAKWCVKP